MRFLHILIALQALDSVEAVKVACKKDACFRNVAFQGEGGPKPQERRADCSSVLR